ncbi:MAG: DUF4136 domain-containing protein [Pseudomonadota bacterium]
MKRMAAIVALALVLGGCAATAPTIRSKVTTFQQWPADLNEKSYQFVAPAAADDTLEYRSYLDLVRKELSALGFSETAGTPALKVAMRFRSNDQAVRVIEVEDPFFHGSGRFGPRYPRMWGWYGGLYDPFWRGPLVHSDELVELQQREVQVAITSAADGKRLFDVTARNISDKESMPSAMPAMVHSAFVGFPGPNGAARTIELKLEPAASAQK